MDPITAFVSLALTTAVKQLISGRQPDRDEWAATASGLVGILIDHVTHTEDSLAGIERRLGKLETGSFEEHMASGRRLLEDLRRPRTADDRREMIRDARLEFVRAVGAAERLSDASRHAMAEIAIAGCWIWVPSLADAQDALRRAEEVLASALLDLDLQAPFEPAHRDDSLLRSFRLVQDYRKGLPELSGRLARLRRLLATYDEVVRLGTVYKAIDQAVAVPTEPDRLTWEKVDLHIPLTIGTTARAMGVEVCVRNVVLDQAWLSPPPIPPLSPSAYERSLAMRALATRTTKVLVDADVAVHPPWPEVGLATWSMDGSSAATDGAGVVTEGWQWQGDHERVLKAGIRWSDTLYVLSKQSLPAPARVALLVRLPHQREGRNPVVAFVVGVPGMHSGSPPPLPGA